MAAIDAEFRNRAASGSVCNGLFGGGAVSPVPPKFPSFYDIPEEIVRESGHWTCYANSQCNVARYEP